MSEYKLVPIKTLKRPDSPSSDIGITGIPLYAVGDVHHIVVPVHTPPQPDASSKKTEDILTVEEVAETLCISVATVERRVAKSREAVARGEAPTFPLPTLVSYDEGKRREWVRKEIKALVDVYGLLGVEDLMKIFKVSYQTVLRWVKKSRSGDGWLPLPLDTGGGERSKLMWHRKAILELKGIKGKRQQPSSNSNSETDSKTDEEAK